MRQHLETSTGSFISVRPLAEYENALKDMMQTWTAPTHQPTLSTAVQVRLRKQDNILES